MREPCTECEGTGKQENGEDCMTCEGTGRESEVDYEPEEDDRAVDE